jgi:hypothetical protein
LKRFANQLTSNRSKQRGQGMTEYTIVTFFGLIIFFGPGLDVLEELANVMRRNYEGYSYAISMSPLPDYPTGPDMITALQNEGVDAATIAKLSVDPAEQAIDDKLQEFTDLKGQLDDALSGFTDVSVDDILDSIKDNAFSIF